MLPHSQSEAPAAMLEVPRLDHGDRVLPRCQRHGHPASRACPGTTVGLHAQSPCWGSARHRCSVPLMLAIHLRLRGMPLRHKQTLTQALGSPHESSMCYGRHMLFTAINSCCSVMPSFARLSSVGNGM